MTVGVEAGGVVLLDEDDLVEIRSGLIEVVPAPAAERTGVVALMLDDVS